MKRRRNSPVARQKRIDDALAGAGAALEDLDAPELLTVITGLGAAILASASIEQFGREPTPAELRDRSVDLLETLHQRIAATLGDSVVMAELLDQLTSRWEARQSGGRILPL